MISKVLFNPDHSMVPCLCDLQCSLVRDCDLFIYFQVISVCKTTLPAIMEQVVLYIFTFSLT